MTRRDTRFAEPEEPHVLRSPNPESTAQGNDNIVDLLRQLAGQGSHLADQQLTLIKAEIRESAADVKEAVGGMLGAAVVGIAGLGVTLMGIAYLLADAIESLGFGTLIVGIAALAVAYALYRSAASKMSSAHLAPDRSQRTLERTPDVARGTLHTENSR